MRHGSPWGYTYGGGGGVLLGFFPRGKIPHGEYSGPTMDIVRKSGHGHIDLVLDNVGAIAQVLWGWASTLLVAEQRILRRVAHRLRWQGVSIGLRHVESALNPADCVSRWASGRGVGTWWLRHVQRPVFKVNGRARCGGRWGTGTRTGAWPSGTVHWRGIDGSDPPARLPCSCVLRSCVVW